MPQQFYNLQDLHRKLWNKAQEVDDNGNKKIYTQIDDHAIHEEYITTNESTSDTHLQVLDDDDGISWNHIKTGFLKVKANHPNEEWWKYNPHQRFN